MRTDRRSFLCVHATGCFEPSVYQSPILSANLCGIMWDDLLFEDIEGATLVANFPQNVLADQVCEIATNRFLTHAGTQFPGTPCW
jgi:hypothetical protein